MESGKSRFDGGNDIASRYALITRKITRQINTISNNHDGIFYVTPLQKNFIPAKNWWPSQSQNQAIMFLFILTCHLATESVRCKKSTVKSDEGMGF